MEEPPLPAVAAPFPSTVSQAFPPSQLSIASCLSPDGTFDVGWWSSGSGVEGSGEGDLSAVAVARVVELRWIGGGAVGELAVDW